MIERVAASVLGWHTGRRRRQLERRWRRGAFVRLAPGDCAEFARLLDQTLMRLNSDYRTKRAGDLGMLPPQLVVVPAGSFRGWMGRNGKLGNQHKVPRVSNDRDVAEGVFRALDGRAWEPLLVANRPPADDYSPEASTRSAMLLTLTQPPWL
jgi:hypothetical protein